jgi:hypothetical protein
MVLDGKIEGSTGTDFLNESASQPFFPAIALLLRLQLKKLKL